MRSGLIADRIGGVGTLILGSTLQCLALIFYLPFDGLMSLYPGLGAVRAVAGRHRAELRPDRARLLSRRAKPAPGSASVLMSTVVGMAIGGWMSGEIFDLTGSYQAAFLNGIAFNLLNMAIAFWLLMGRLRTKIAA